jgi:hypothetical protein
MRPSPRSTKVIKMTFVQRALILISLTLIAGLSIGFFIGQSDEQILRQLGLGRASLTLVIEDSNILNDDLIHLFEAQSNISLRVLKAQSFEDFKKFSLEADLWIARTCWLERLALIKPTPGLINESWAKKNISPDFLTFNHQEISSAPVLWNVGESLHANGLEKAFDREFKTLPLFLIGIKAIDSTAAHRAVEELTKRQFIQTWVETVPWATTYMSLDESLIEKYQKASFIRELPFQRLELVDGKNPKCDLKIGKSVDQKTH